MSHPSIWTSQQEAESATDFDRLRPLFKTHRSIPKTDFKNINKNFKLDEINLLFQPNMRSKLLWFYQEVDEPETVPVPEVPKPGPSRAAASNTSKTPQGKFCITFDVPLD